MAGFYREGNFFCDMVNRRRLFDLLLTPYTTEEEVKKEIYSFVSALMKDYPDATLAEVTNSVGDIVENAGYAQAFNPENEQGGRFVLDRHQGTDWIVKAFRSNGGREL